MNPMNAPTIGRRFSGFFRPEAALLNTDREDYRFFVVTHYIYLFSLVGHLAFIPLFAALGIIPLALYNVASVLVFTVCIAVNKAGRHRAAFFVGAVEVVVHSALCALLIGWDTGFHYFIVGVIPFAMMIPGLRSSIRTTMAFIVLVLYGVVYFASELIATPFLLAERMTAILNYANLVITFGAFSFLVHYLAQASIRAEAAVGELSRTDFLTGVLNRRGMLTQLETEYATFRRTGRPFSVLIVDLDRFKRVNDRYGHAAGDAVLTATARLFQETLRARDQLCRWGGEEFLVLLPETDLAGTRIVAEKILGGMRGLNVPFGSLNLSITVTIGGACCNRRATVDQIIVCADRALYSGKDGGRDRVVLCRDITRCNEAHGCSEIDQTAMDQTATDQTGK